MYGSFPCPRCGESLLAKAKKCECGWKEGKGKDAHQAPLACSHDVNGYPCGRKADFNFQRLDGVYFSLCEGHYDDVREKGGVEVEMLRRAKQYSDGAKQMGLSNYEFLHEKKPPERVLKELLGWASHGQKKTGS